MILFQNYSTFLPFILGDLISYYPQRERKEGAGAENGKRELSKSEGVSCTLGIKKETELLDSNLREVAHSKPNAARCIHFTIFARDAKSDLNFAPISDIVYFVFRFKLSKTKSQGGSAPRCR